MLINNYLCVYLNGYVAELVAAFVILRNYWRNPLPPMFLGIDVWPKLYELA
jgi:hypothetical protein